MPSAHPSVVIIGTGFGGIGMAIELKRAGFDDIVLLEKGDDIGGVWRENTYPGAGCDIPSPYYSFSYAPNPDWPMRFSLRADIHAYMRRTADKYGITPHIRFNSEVTGAAFAGLKPEHQTILTLRVVEEQSYEAIAETLGVPIGTVMSRLSRARADLKARLAARTGETT